jgi:hypothetical protein
MLKRSLSYSVVTVLAASCLFAQTPGHVQTFPLRHTTGLIAPKVKTGAVKYLGRRFRPEHHGRGGPRRPRPAAGNSMAIPARGGCASKGVPTAHG